MAPQPGQEVAVERVVEVDRERKEEPGTCGGWKVLARTASHGLI